MKLYLFTVPEHLATPAFEADLSGQFGGYTRLESKGSWLDIDRGRREERNAVYLVAVPGPGVAADLRYWLMGRLRDAGEQAAFLAEIGTAKVISLRAQ